MDHLVHDPSRVAALAKGKPLGKIRRERLMNHIALCTTLLTDESTCQIWSDFITESRFAGKPIATGDAWIAAARQWDLPLITNDYRDFEHLGGIKLVRVS